ncbi:MAG TPA: nucleotidyltransferase [Thiolapillus brandeum]|uniref:Nucleotidyltransferase n=1 Tax=Thiolapillus brandeum TaxID=1076588 RepID=A0A7C5N0J6_9GAMM|nr:nucleotidyltransferase [Thiolapillus brandeum]
MIDYTKFEKALQHLEAQFQNYRTLDPSLPRLLQEAVAESVVQRFETTYDCLWKVLKRHLVEKLGLPEVPNSPKPVFRLAHENHLLPGKIEDWIEYANLRVATAHDYSGEKAQKALEQMEDFIRDAIALHERLSGRPWR